MNIFRKFYLLIDQKPIKCIFHCWKGSFGQQILNQDILRTSRRHRGQNLVLPAKVFKLFCWDIYRCFFFFGRWIIFVQWACAKCQASICTRLAIGLQSISWSVLNVSLGIQWRQTTFILFINHRFILQNCILSWCCIAIFWARDTCAYVLTRPCVQPSPSASILASNCLPIFLYRCRWRTLGENLAIVPTDQLCSNM